MSRRRSVHALRLMKKEPRLKPPQSCGMTRLMDESLPSPIRERERGSRYESVKGWEMLRGL